MDESTVQKMQNTGQMCGVEQNMRNCQTKGTSSDLA